MGMYFLFLTYHDTFLYIDNQNRLCHVKLEMKDIYHPLYGIMINERLYIFIVVENKICQYIHSLDENMVASFSAERKEQPFIRNSDDSISLTVFDKCFLSSARNGQMELVKNNNSWEKYRLFYPVHPQKIDRDYSKDVIFFGKQKVGKKSIFVTMEEFSDLNIMDVTPFGYDIENIFQSWTQYCIEIEDVYGVSQYSVYLCDYKSGEIIHFESYLSTEKATFSFVIGSNAKDLKLFVKPGGYKIVANSDGNSMNVGKLKVNINKNYRNIVDICMGGSDVISNVALLPVGICPVWDNRSGIATIISDDGHFQSGLILNKLSKEIGIHLTVAGSVKFIAPHLKEWQDIENNGYVEVVNHTYNHIPINPNEKKSKKEIIHEYKDAMKYLRLNFKTPSFTFVYPYNSTTETGEKVIEEMGILAARRGARGDNSLLPIYGHGMGELLNLKMHGIGDTTERQIRNWWVDKAIIKHRWVLEMWHDVSPKGDIGYQPISIDEAEEHMRYLKEQEDKKNLWVASFSQAVSYIYQRIHTRVWACHNDTNIWLFFVRENHKLPWNEFNSNLTISLQLPDKWRYVKVIRGTCKDAVLEKDLNGRVHFDVSVQDDTMNLRKMAIHLQKGMNMKSIS